MWLPCLVAITCQGSTRCSQHAKGLLCGLLLRLEVPCMLTLLAAYHTHCCQASRICTRLQCIAAGWIRRGKG